MKKLISMLILLIAGAILMQGFQCSSKEFTTAKVAEKNKEWEKAGEFYRKEVTKNPKNEEAWLGLVRIHMQTSNFAKAAEAVKQAREHVQKPENKQQLIFTEYKLWADNYQTAIKYYNQYFNKKNNEFLKNAKEKLNVSIAIRPELADLYELLGRIHEAQGDTAKAIENYNKFIKIQQPGVDFAISKELFVEMPESVAKSKLPAPDTTESYQYGQKDSAYSYRYNMGQDKFYLFTRSNAEGEVLVMGWRYNPPEYWPSFEKMQPTALSLNPWIALGQLYADREDFDNAIPYVKQLSRLQPTNPTINNFLVQLYQQAGKIDVALESIKDMVEKNPDNEFYWAQWGDILLTKKEYNEAIEKYEKALELEPNFVLVMRNAASAYKNLASIIQRRQQDQEDEDPDYEADPEEYFPLLRKSAEYFEKVLNSGEVDDRMEVIAELVNIYQVIDNRDKLKEYLVDLESMEATISQSKKERYYLTLLKVYDVLKMSDKLEEVKGKLEQF